MLIEGNLRLKYTDRYPLLIGLIAVQNAMISSTLLKPIFDIIKYPLLGLILFLMMWLIAEKKKNIQTWIGFLSLILLGINTSRILSTNAILYIVILTFLSRGEDIQKGANILVKVLGSVFAVNIIVFLVQYFLTKENLSFLDWHGFKRYFLYYDHPNNAAKYFIFLCAIIVYLYANELKWKHWILMLLGMFGMYYFTRSDSLYVITILFLLTTLREKRVFNKGINFFSKYGMIIFSCISAGMALFINIPIISNIFFLFDEIGSGRFSNLYRAVQRYGITWLGQRVLFGNHEIVGGYEGIYADNLTVYCMTYLGAIYIFILGYFFYKTSDQVSLCGKIYRCIFLIFTLFENRVFGIEAYFVIMISYGSCKMREGGVILNDLFSPLLMYKSQSLYAYRRGVCI